MKFCVDLWNWSAGNLKREFNIEHPEKLSPRSLTKKVKTFLHDKFVKDSQKTLNYDYRESLVSEVSFNDTPVSGEASSMVSAEV